MEYKIKKLRTSRSLPFHLDVCMSKSIFSLSILIMVDKNYLPKFHYNASFKCFYLSQLAIDIGHILMGLLQKKIFSEM